MNLQKLLAEKTAEIEQQLTQWVESKRILQPGQTLRFEIAVVAVKPVTGIVRIETNSSPEISASPTTPTWVDFSQLPAEKLEMRMADLGLGTRAANALSNNDCYTTFGAFLKRYEDFPKWRNAGPKTYVEIREAFHRIGIQLPWPFEWRNKERKTLNQLEREQIKTATLTEGDWETILSVGWRSYQKSTIEWLHESQNKPASARSVLKENHGASRLYSLTTINDKFRKEDLPYRLYVASQAQSSLGETGLVHLGDEICIGKLP